MRFILTLTDDDGWSIIVVWFWFSSTKRKRGIEAFAAREHNVYHCWHEFDALNSTHSSIAQINMNNHDEYVRKYCRDATNLKQIGLNILIKAVYEYITSKAQNWLRLAAYCFQCTCVTRWFTITTHYSTIQIIATLLLNVSDACVSLVLYCNSSGVNSGNSELIWLSISEFSCIMIVYSRDYWMWYLTNPPIVQKTRCFALFFTVLKWIKTYIHIINDAFKSVLQWISSFFRFGVKEHVCKINFIAPLIANCACEKVKLMKFYYWLLDWKWCACGYQQVRFVFAFGKINRWDYFSYILKKQQDC